MQSCSTARRCGGASRSSSQLVTLQSSPSPKPPNSVLPDVVAPGLRVLFCGINPGYVSAAAGAHFANPRNDFWRLLHEAGFTPTLLEPSEQFELLRYRIGVTNAASRTTRGLRRPAPRRFCGCGGTARAPLCRPPSEVDRLRRQGGVPRRLPRATALRRAGAAVRRDAALRPSLDLARERGGAVGRTSPLVPRACAVEFLGDH
jgi:hypothetical protein